MLNVIPDTWAVEEVTGFLESALRQLLTKRNEALVERALTSTQNLDVSARLIEKLDTFQPVLDLVENVT